MDTNGIKKIESALGINLPAHYVDLVTNYPEELWDTEAQDFGLLNNPDSVIEENKFVRQGPFYGDKWPNNFLIIGINGCGDYYVTMINGKDFSTGFFDHEVPAFFPHSTSRSEFIEKLLREQNDEIA